jgi:hypothetical protein
LKASFCPLPFYHPDKLVAGNLSHGLTHIAGTLPASLEDHNIFDKFLKFERKNICNVFLPKRKMI